MDKNYGSLKTVFCINDNTAVSHRMKSNLFISLQLYLVGPFEVGRTDSFSAYNKMSVIQGHIGMMPQQLFTPITLI